MVVKPDLAYPILALAYLSLPYLSLPILTLPVTTKKCHEALVYLPVPGSYSVADSDYAPTFDAPSTTYYVIYRQVGDRYNTAAILYDKACVYQCSEMLLLYSAAAENGFPLVHNSAIIISPFRIYYKNKY